MMIDDCVPTDPAERRHVLFADAEAREDAPEKIVRGELTRDFAECLLGRAQLLCDELARATLAQLARAFFDAGAGPHQRIEVALTRGNSAGFDSMETHRELQV